MTSKEKAKELFDKFYYVIPSFELPIDDQVAKECALIAVDEIIDCLLDDDLYIKEGTNFDIFIKYWNQVKEEIEKL